MKNLIMNKEAIVKKNFERGYDTVILSGTMASNLDGIEPVFIEDPEGNKANIVIDSDNGNWVGTKAYKQHWNSIEATLESIRKEGKAKFNTAQFPNDYYDLIEKISIDLTKRRIENVDFTAMLTNEQTNLSFSRSVNLKEFLGFVGEFQENNLTGDSVPLIEQRTGAIGSVEMTGYALGHTRSLEDVLYNLDIFSIQNVNEAFIRAFIGKRNNEVWAKMISLSEVAGDDWDASQKVAADATSGASLEDKVYRTINAAIAALGALYDFQTNQEITLSKIVVALGTNVDARKVNRAINGQINNSKGINSNREPLEVDEIWLYKGDSFSYGNKQIVYKGINTTANVGYMFIPGPAGAPTHTLVKRPLTTVTSEGSALNLSQKAESKYFIQTKYNDEWFGTSAGNTVIDANTTHNWGYVVEFTLPV